MEPEAARTTAVALGPRGTAAAASPLVSSRGRASATATAARRSVRAVKRRMRLRRRRRSVSRRARRMKSMAGNGVGFGRRRKKRWMATGIAAASAPHSRSGFTNPRLIASRGAPLAAGEEREEHLVRRPVRPGERVVDVRLGGRLAHLLEPGAQHLEIPLAHVAAA